MAEEKFCNGCLESKPLSEFNRCRSKRDGRQSRCATCTRTASLKWAKENAERVKANDAAYYAENRERLAVKHSEYYRENRDRVLRHHADYAAENAETIKQRKAVYRTENPHIVWGMKYRRRAKEYGFNPVVESFTRDELIARWGDVCWHCGGEFVELDHFPVPVSRGGAHSLENCRPSCTPCNRRSWRTETA